MAVWFFFFNDTATTEIYTLSLHDALPILAHRAPGRPGPAVQSRHHDGFRRGPEASARHQARGLGGVRREPRGDRKSTRLNSSHANISYAVFCLKKKREAAASGLYSLPKAT